jgi:UDP-glucose 4-epimerase
VSILGLAELVLETLGVKAPIELVPYAEAYAPDFDDMRRRKPVVEKLARMTGFRPLTSLREIIRLTAEWRVE